MKQIIHSKKDYTGNELRVYRDSTAPEVLDIRLYVKAKKEERKLGLVDKEKRTLYISRDRSKHLLTSNNSYGFNYLLLNEAKTFDIVLIRDSVSAFRVPRSVLLNKGEFLFFKTQGFEKQIFVPLSVLDSFSVTEKLF
jgi:hypothetical protein